MGTKPRKRRLNRVLLLPLIVFSVLIVSQMLAYRAQSNKWKKEALEKPKVIYKVKYKTKVKTKVIREKVYINRRKSGGVEKWRGLVAKYFPSNAVNTALSIMACESGGNPNAVSHTNDHGLFQINGGLQAYGEKIYNPEFNIKLAYTNYYATRGWQPWVCASKLGIL
jgi:soluble lytic murein transglycosylase-like protein